MSKTRLLTAVTGLCLALAVGSYAVSGGAGAASVAARKANFKEIGGDFKTISDELKSGSPDMNSVRPAARDLAARSAQLSKYFPLGSGAESGVKTRAKPEIWSKAAEFQKLQSDFVAASNTLNAAAASGNVGALTSARAALGQACKSCHDRFRQPD